MTDRHAAGLFALLLTCFTVYLCFRGIAWVIRHGWRSMFGLVALRGEAILTVDDNMSCGCRRDGRTESGCLTCGHTRCPRHRDVPHECKRDDIGAMVDAVNEDHDKEHLALWEAELSRHAGIQKYARRMEGWSR